MDSTTLCVKGCGKPTATSGRRCFVCLEKQRRDNRRYYAKRVARGQCPSCRKSAEVGIFCFKHWLKNVGVPHGLGNGKGIALLQRLWEEQKGQCAITGETLIPGATASIDHIIPKSRGGASVNGNLQWVLLQVNRIKWDMTNEEFVETCRKVVRAADRRSNEQMARSN